MKLYRGLKEPYRPEKVGAGQGRMFGTDFTDCPFAALRYARGRRAVVLVVGLDEGQARVTEETWPDASAKRIMVWGSFDDFIVAMIPAQELRAHVRRKGIVTSSDEHKAYVVECAIRDWSAPGRA
jgi:hypothetical protein